jgi:uncharacterized protein
VTHLRFDWDPKKAKVNWNKHRVRFEDALLAFDDPFALIAFDDAHSETEVREILIGRGTRQVFVVVFAPDEEVRRIISARLATRAERKRYEESKILPL